MCIFLYGRQNSRQNDHQFGALTNSQKANFLRSIVCLMESEPLLLLAEAPQVG